MSLFKNGLGIIGLVGVLLVLGWIFYPSKTDEVVTRAEAIGSAATDNALTALEKRVGASRIAIEHLKKEKERRRNALIDVKTAQKDLQRRAEEAGSEADRLAMEGKEDKAARQRATQQMLAGKAEEMTATVQKVQKQYESFCEAFERKKEDLQLADIKLGVLRTELDALGKGSASASAERAKALEDELKNMCSRLESEIEVAELED